MSIFTGISGNASYPAVCDAFSGHWLLCNEALPPASPLRIKRPNETLVLRSDFDGLRDSLLAQYIDVRAKLTQVDLARGTIEIIKTKLLERLNQFLVKLDGKWLSTHFYRARPYAPGIRDGQENFCNPMFDMMTLWADINAGPPPAGVTLPLVLPATDLQTGTMSQGAFASFLSSLAFAYADERAKLQRLTLARAKRDEIQADLYEIMKAYREDVPGDLMAFPTLVETMPRLSPLPGHTPQAVNARATFVPPDQSRIVHGESTDAMLHSYQLRGHAGTEYDEVYAEVIATHTPSEPREFLTSFGLSEPGVHMVFKVFVVLTTGNEAGSAAVSVQRPLAQAA